MSAGAEEEEEVQTGVWRRRRRTRATREREKKTRDLDLRDGRKIAFMSRKHWYQTPTVEVPPREELAHPVQYVRFTQSGGWVCGDNTQCIRTLQKTQVAGRRKEIINDITHNFYVGGDRGIYEGRGWWAQSKLSEEHAGLEDKCLDIAYIGDFGEKQIPYRMLVAGIDFLTFGIKQGYISPYFKLIPYVQIPPEFTKEELKKMKKLNARVLPQKARK